MCMIRAYSQRLLPPYSGCVQIADSERGRAQSFDGVSWEIHYMNRTTTRKQGYALDRGYYRVAHFRNNHLKPYILPSCLNSAEVAASIDELAEFLAEAPVPFPAADIFEYWLLDGADGSPLALIFSCCEESQMSTYPARASWTALPHSKMQIENTADEKARNEAPVNHRFQNLVADRAGARPRAAWFRRDQNGSGGIFPGFLVKEDWRNEADHELCQRYLQRKAPRLLMLQGLSRSDRERMEIAARRYAIEVDQYYPLYPEVNDQQRMTAIRVEARLRQSTPHESRAKETEHASAPQRMSKDMRIFET